MATVSYTLEENAQSGVAKVEWTGLTAGDDGQPFDSSGFELSSYHAFGSFSGTANIQGSNEITPSDFRTIVDIGSPRLEPFGGGSVTAFAGSIRPFFSSGGSGILNMAIVMRKVS